MSLLNLYYKNTVLRFVWYPLKSIQLFFKFIFIYPASTNSKEQHHHFLHDHHCHRWVYHIYTTKVWFLGLCDKVDIYSTRLKVYIYLPSINTQQQTTASFSLWLPLSQVTLPYWYYENTVSRLVWYCLVFIELILKFISVYTASKHSNKKRAQFSSKSPFSRVRLLHWYYKIRF